MSWPDAKRDNHPCKMCKKIMEYVPLRREICTPCRKQMEKESAARRRKEKKENHGNKLA